MRRLNSEISGLRAIGPSVTDTGMPNALQHQTLELVNGNGDWISSNNNWRDTQQAEIEATTIPPSSDLESASLQTVSAGAYTAIVRGIENGTGVSVVEVYNLPKPKSVRAGDHWTPKSVADATVERESS